MWTDWATIWTPPNIALAVFGSLVAAVFVWSIPRLVRVAFKQAWGVAKRELRLIDVAVNRYRVSEGFDRITFQNYIGSQVRRSGVDTWFDTFVVFGVGASFSAAIKLDALIASLYGLAAAVFVTRLIIGTMKHVRFLVIEEEIYRHVSLQSTAELMRASESGSIQSAPQQEQQA